MLTIVDYGLGNLLSVKNMLKKIGINSKISNSINEINQAEKLILPGVGAFDNGMQRIRERGLESVLTKRVMNDKIPIFGICLGMQLLGKRSEEGNEAGLGWIDAETVKFQFTNKVLKVPHMGWDYIKVKTVNPLISINQKQRYYFVHSYHVKCNNTEDVMATCHYGIEFTSMIHRENIFGAQFHPEKSLSFGMELLQNFVKL
ncbi:MAG: imidazole glycerol phosphate synthase subunit HisH [Bacteroidia bacterium]|jgi:imidazole glycerol-phosphate synthase subunit HisH